VRKVQEQLHSQGLSVTLGSLDCALAQAFGLTGSLSDFGYQPRDLAPMQASGDAACRQVCIALLCSPQAAGCKWRGANAGVVGSSGRGASLRQV
jgi:hypothetical protein